MTERAGDLPLAETGRPADRLAALLDARDARVRAWGAAPPPSPATLDVLVARLGEVRVAFPCGALAAVVSPVSPTPLPGAASALAGVFVHGGRVHSALLPDEALGLPAPAGERRVGLVLRRSNLALAVAVDEALAVTRAVPPQPNSRYAEVEGQGAVLLVDPDAVLGTLGVAVPTTGRIDAA